jgi:hypothetical protein
MILQEWINNVLLMLMPNHFSTEGMNLTTVTLKGSEFRPWAITRGDNTGLAAAITMSAIAAIKDFVTLFFIQNYYH